MPAFRNTLGCRCWPVRGTSATRRRDPAAPPDLAEIRAYCKQRLPGYAAPRALELVPALPQLPNGKPDLAALRRGAVPEPAGGPAQGNPADASLRDQAER